VLTRTASRAARPSAVPQRSRFPAREQSGADRRSATPAHVGRGHEVSRAPLRARRRGLGVWPFGL